MSDCGSEIRHSRATPRTSTSTSGSFRPSFQFVEEEIEQMIYQAENGVVGVEQKDETHYDTRYKNKNGLSDDEDNDFEDDREEDDVDPHHLPFSRKKLYGRSKEMEVINDHLHRMLTSPSAEQEEPVPITATPNCIFLSGYSGSGKTRLAREAVRRFTKEVLRQQKQDQENISVNDSDTTKPVQPIFISGKYEELRTPNPYKGISEAFGNWYASLSGENQSVFTFIQQELEQKADEDDAALLMEMIPKISSNGKGQNKDDVLAVSSSENAPETAIGHTKNVSAIDSHSLSTASSSRRKGKYESQASHRSINKSRFHFVFRLFLECLCVQESPVVLFLDDLQWADSDSLRLLQYLLSAADPIPYFLLIGSFRSNEVQSIPDHPLSNMIDAVNLQYRNRHANEAKALATAVQILELSNLSQSDVTTFISDTLSRSIEDVMPLSNVVYNKTLGNMFFTIQALEQLVRKNAIYYDTICFEWSFRCDKTSKSSKDASTGDSLEEYLESLLSSEVVEMVQSKIQFMPVAMQYLLIVASYIRSTFPASILHEVLETIQDMERQTTSNQSGNPPSLSIDKRCRLGEDILEDSSWCDWTFQNVMKYLDQAVLEGLLVYADDDDDDSNAGTQAMNMEKAKREVFADQEYYFSFAHDRIREAASRFIMPGKDKDFILLQIANILSERGMISHPLCKSTRDLQSLDSADWMLFTAVGHYNSIPTLSDQATLQNKSTNINTYTLSILKDYSDDEYKFEDYFMSFNDEENINETEKSYRQRKEKMKNRMLEFRIRLATLHRATCQLSISKAAFSNVAVYSEKGLQWLFLGSPNSYEVSDLQRLNHETNESVQFLWKCHQRLCHDLYIFAAESSKAIGDIPKMESYCNLFLAAQKHESLDAKFNIYYIMAQGIYYGTDRFGEAKQIVLRLLEHLNCRFPKGAVMSGLQAVSGLLRLNGSKTKRTKEELEGLEPMTDPSKLEAMRLLDKLFEICYACGDIQLLPLVICRGIDYTFKYGYSIHSSRIIASAGILFVGVLKDYSGGGALYPKYALDMLETKLHNHRLAVAETLFLAYAFSLHHTTPYSECKMQLMKVYNIGMSVGQFDSALWGVYNAMTMSIICGSAPLTSIQADLAKHIPMMESMGKRSHAIFGRCTWNAVLGLLGSSKEVSLIEWSEAEQNNPALRNAKYGFERIELGYLGEYEACAERSIQDRNQLMEALPGLPFPIIDICLCALSCAIMLHEPQMTTTTAGKRSKYKKDLKRTRGWIKSWIKHGNPNIVHWDALIQAEVAISRKKYKEAKEHFKSAVTLALKGGFLHDAAIANERWGIFALKILADANQAEQYMKQAIQLYRQRGAIVNITKLKDKYPRLLARPITTKL